MEWNDVKIDNLITLVAEHPELYEPNASECVDKATKENIWLSIAKKMGTSARNCRRKWTGLCINFHKRQAEGKLIIRGEEWPWFESMRFIKPDETGNEVNGIGGEARDPSMNGAEEARDNNNPTTPLGSPFPSACIEEINELNFLQEQLNPSLRIENVFCRSQKDFKPSLKTSDNELFFKSLVNDVSALDLKDQYDFRVEVLTLLRRYILKEEN